MRWAECCRCVSRARWFALIGVIGNDLGTAFIIGANAVHEAKHSDELTCFANDLRMLYWNNRGKVRLSVTRVQ